MIRSVLVILTLVTTSAFATIGCSASSAGSDDDGIAAEEAAYTGAKLDGEFVDRTGQAPVSKLRIAEDGTTVRFGRDPNDVRALIAGYGTRLGKSYFRLYELRSGSARGPLVESYEWKLQQNELTLRLVGTDAPFVLEQKRFYDEDEVCGDGRFECAEGLVCRSPGRFHPACPPEEQCSICLFSPDA